MKRLKPAVRLEGSLIGREVSCGIFSGLFAAARDAGVDLEELVDGTGFALPHYLDPTKRVSWSAVQELGHRISDIWSEEELCEIGARSLDIQHLEPQIVLARLLLRPTEAYAFIIRGDSRGDFACLSARTTVDGQHVDIRIDIAEGYDHCPSLFWILCGSAQVVPKIFGLAPAEVEMTLREHGAHLSIEVPEGGGRWSRLNRVRHGLWRSRRLDVVGDRLSQRTLALETEVAKRLSVEVELKSALDGHDRRLASLNDVIIELEVDGAVSFVSSNISAVLGVDEEVFRADPWKVLDPPPDDVSGSWITRIASTDRWCEINPSRYSDDEPAALLLVVREVTDRIALAEQVSSASRLESLGVMAAGVAHDFNNLLVPIAANAESLVEDLDQTSPMWERIVAIERAARMASQLTADILVSTGQPMPNDGSCDVAAVVRSMMPVLVALVPGSVDVVFEDAPPAPASVDEESLSKLVTNLVVNAGQAITNEGTVWLSVQTTADTVKLRVRDDGVGMSPETIARMYEPFFTTRPEGSGLGLASLAGLLQRGTATLDVASTVDEGTTIEVSFARLTSVAAAAEVAAPGARASRGASILLIDDDDLVRRTIHQLLERTFDSVQSVATAREAVAFLNAGTSVDCVISDLTMSDLRGPELITELRHIRPGVPAILITGAGRDRAISELNHAGLTDIAVLLKPFSPQELFDAVSSELAPIS